MNQLRKNLQGDIIKIAGKKIFINPFLYSRKLDQKTKDWLREMRRLSDSEIFENRIRFYPELEWKNLSEDEKDIANATIEMFLKTMELIKTFHPYLSLDQLSIVERNLLFYKKYSFEKWVKRQFKKQAKYLLREKRKSYITCYVNTWRNWLSIKETQKILMPVFVMILFSTLLGWFAGVSKNSCNPYFESNISHQL